MGLNLNFSNVHVRSNCGCCGVKDDIIRELIREVVNPHFVYGVDLESRLFLLLDDEYKIIKCSASFPEARSKMIGKKICQVFEEHECRFYKDLLEQVYLSKEALQLHVAENGKTDKLLVQPIVEDGVVFGYILSRFNLEEITHNNDHK